MPPPTAENTEPGKASTRAWLQMHFCVVLWGFTAILGKLISLPASALVWWRMVLVTAALACIPRVWRGIRVLSAKMIATYAGIGCLVAIHWLAFYGSIKLSNASVAVTCIAFGSVFVAFVEPQLTGRVFQWRELLLGVAVIPGVALVVGGTPSEMRLGILLGIGAAALVGVFGSLNKRFVTQADPFTVTAIEMAAGAMALTVLVPLFADNPFIRPDNRDSLLLLALALACTLLPYVLSLVALRHLTAFSAQLAINIEPVYGILLAIVFLGEQRQLGAQFYVGVAIIVGAVMTHAMRSE